MMEMIDDHWFWFWFIFVRLICAQDRVDLSHFSLSIVLHYEVVEEQNSMA